MTTRGKSEEMDGD